ncbi:MAG: exonuclease domain-containing protein [Proteobacteria bacterium]|nr:exonuclease domain-containing protein [Pseudomonadota bacterium]
MLISSTHLHHHHQSSAKRPLHGVPFIILDMEMTGGNPKNNGIMEIFAIKYSAGQVGEHFHQLINPEVHISPILKRITGINQQIVADCPTIDQVIQPFLDFIGHDSVFVAHNVACDLIFLRYFAQKCAGITPRNFALCTHLLGAKIFPTSPQKSLLGLCRFLNLAPMKAHRAKNDALMTLSLFQELEKQFTTLGLTHLEHLLRYQGDFDSLTRLGWRISEKHLSELPKKPGVYWLKNENNQLLLWGAASQLQQTVHHLPKRDDLGRSKMRKMMQATDIEYRTMDNDLDAYLYDLRGTKTAHTPRQKKIAPPYLFDCRFLILSHDANNQRYIIAMKKPQVSNIAIFTPRHHNRHPKHGITQLTHYPNINLTKDTLYIHEKEDLPNNGVHIVTYLIYMWHRAMDYVRRRQNKTARHKRYQDIMITKWLEAEVTSHWENLSSIWGFMVFRPNSNDDTSKIYPMFKGAIQDPITCPQGFNAWQKSIEGKRLISEMKTRQKQPGCTPGKPCSERLTLGLWCYAYYQKKLTNISFIPL